jgi:putative GTP pyrophosphokinase
VSVMTKNHTASSTGETDINALVNLYKRKKRYFELFLQSVQAEFSSSIELNTGVPTTVHSIKSRLKDEDHLAEKLQRKLAEGRTITTGNLFSEITDFAGLRVLHLYQDQFSLINSFIMRRVKTKNWKLLEKPVAYTWDPESVNYFKHFKITTSVKSSFYTSVHYVIAPGNDQENISCEIQVRTLFEEAWGEIDHSINYPLKTDKMANIEQLRVLSKLVSTGSRLADAIFKVHNS